MKFLQKLNCVEKVEKGILREQDGGDKGETPSTINSPEYLWDRGLLFLLNIQKYSSKELIQLDFTKKVIDDFFSQASKKSCKYQTHDDKLFSQGEKIEQRDAALKQSSGPAKQSLQSEL